jgi:hypothetical protein
MRTRHILAALGMAAALASGARADFDVKVDLENLSGQVRKDWPVILTVRRVFGNDLPVGSIDPKAFHVYDEKGRELAWSLERIPPYDQVGNDELVFVIPTLKPGQKVTYQVTNTHKPGRQTAIDVVTSPHNLVRNGGFETGDETPEGFEGQAALDKVIKHGGARALEIKGTRRVTVKYAEPIPLHKGSPYYFGAWGKTDNVSRHGLWMSNGATFELPGFSNGYDGNLMPAGDVKKTPEQLAKDIIKRRQAKVYPQCATRDWAKVTWRTVDYTDWGVEQLCATAVDDTTTLSIVLDQQKQFWMPEGKTEGRWWVDDIVLMEQPKVTVRFDEQLSGAMKDGIFLFTRPTSTPLGNYLPRWNRYCAMPFTHESVERIDRDGIRGQRVPFVLGVYHDKPLGTIEVKVKGGALASPDGQKIALTEIEYLPGYLGANPEMLMQTVNGPVQAKDAPRLPYLVASFVVPKDAKPAKYSGAIEVLVGGKAYQSIPISLAVQDLDEPVIRDAFLGFIWQGTRFIPFYEEALTQYSKAGFTSVTPFFTFLRLSKTDPPQVDFEDLDQRMKRLVHYGITAGVCLYTDVDLGSRHSGGTIWKRTQSEESYKRVIKSIDDEARKHPDWPRIIYMTWDEPNLGEKWVPGKHGGPDPRMGWVNAVCPDALTNADCHFRVFGEILKYYNMPTFDDPPDFCGPEIYSYLKSIGKDFGFAGAKEPGECPRYEIGIMMIASGARYFHQWHLQFPSRLMAVVDDKVLRSYEMVQVGEGIDDFKIHRVLRDSIEKAKASNDAKRKAIAREAEDYLAKVFTVWNADHINEACYPYLGYAYQWGYDRFYDDWHRQMMKYAVALSGAKWVE